MTANLLYALESRVLRPDEKLLSNLKSRDGLQEGVHRASKREVGADVDPAPFERTVSRLALNPSRMSANALLWTCKS